jgi:hypothetical protein
MVTVVFVVWLSDVTAVMWLKPEICFTKTHTELHFNAVPSFISTTFRVCLTLLKTKRICFISALSAYRAVNTLHFGYKNQSLNVL